MQQQAESNITTLATCRAQGESHDDRLGQLERKYEEVVQANRILAQQAENLHAQQLLDQTSLQELRERVDEKLDQSVQPVTFAVPIVQSSYYYPEASQASAVGVLEGQPVLDALGNQPGAALYPGSQESEARLNTETKDLEGLLDSSSQTLLQTPKTPDTSFESRRLVARQKGSSQA